MYLAPVNGKWPVRKDIEKGTPTDKTWLSAYRRTVWVCCFLKNLNMINPNNNKKGLSMLRKVRNDIGKEGI